MDFDEGFGGVGGAGAVAGADVVVEDLLEVGDDGVSTECSEEAAIDVDGSFGFLEGAGERDADVGVLGFAGAIDDAAHDGELEFFDAGVGLAPDGHGVAEVVLNLLGELLEEGAGGASAAGAGGDLRGEAADAEGLENLLAGVDFFGAVTVGLGSEGDADGVSNAVEQQGREAGGGGDDAFHAHSGFGEAEVEGVVAAGGEHLVDVDEIEDAGDLGAEDDLVMAEAVFFGGGGGVEGAAAHGFEHDGAGGERLGEAGVFVHEAGEEGLIERAPVDADADGLVVLDGALDHGAEVVVVFAADGDVAGVDAVLGEGLGAVGIFLEELVAVVMEVANDGDVDAEFVEAFNDGRDGFSGGVVVDGDADELRSGGGKRGDLLDGGLDVGGVCVGHGLDDDGSVRTDANLAYVDRNGLSAMCIRHEDPHL